MSTRIRLLQICLSGVILGMFLEDTADAGVLYPPGTGQIKEFYETLNLVNSYSRISARHYIAKHFSDLPTEYASERMTLVWALMQKLDQRIVRLDDSMIKGVPRWWMPSALYTVLSVAAEGDECAVRVRVSSVRPTAVSHFLDGFDEEHTDLKELPPAVPQELRARAHTVGEEIHKWRFGDGWKKSLVPVVEFTNPLPDERSVATHTLVAANFSARMDPGTINESTFLLHQDSLTVKGAVSYINASNVAVFSPSAALTPNTLYTATVTTGAQTVSGQVLASDMTWTFRTTEGIFPFGGEMQLFLGDLHSHTAYSDGKGTPADAFATARANGLDFLGVTDHSKRLSAFEWTDTQARAALRLPRRGRRRDDGGQLLRRQLPAVFVLEQRTDLDRPAETLVDARPRRALRPLRAHPLLPEALRFLLLPGVHRQ